MNFAGILAGGIGSRMEQSVFTQFLDIADVPVVIKVFETGRFETLDLPKAPLEAVADANVLMYDLCPVTKTLLAKEPKIKLVLCNRCDNENVDLDNCTLANHRGGDTINSYSDSPAAMMKAAQEFFEGDRPRYWINPEIQRTIPA